MIAWPNALMLDHPMLKRFVEGIRSYGGHALFLSYMLSIAAVVLSNSLSAPEKILLWSVLPLFVATALFPPRDDENEIIAQPTAMLGRSLIFWACVVYVGATLLPTFTSQEAVLSASTVLKIYGRRGLEIILFVGITIWLSAIYPLFFRRFVFLMTAFLAVNALINIGAFVQLVDVRSLEAVRLSGTFGTPDFRNATHVAPLFVIYAMAALAVSMTTGLTAWQRWLLRTGVLILVAGIVMTWARGALVAMIIAALIIAAAASKRARWLILVFTSIIVVAAFALAPVREALLSRGASYRAELWAAYLEIASTKFWLGHGLHQIIEVTIRGSVFEQPHNTLIWAQLRGGIIGATAAAILLVGSLWSGLRYWRRTADAAPFIMVAMLVVTSITEIGFLIFPYDWIWITFWLPVALAAGLETTLQTRPRRSEATVA